MGMCFICRFVSMMLVMMYVSVMLCVSVGCFLRNVMLYVAVVIGSIVLNMLVRLFGMCWMFFIYS